MIEVEEIIEVTSDEDNNENDFDDFRSGKGLNRISSKDRFKKKDAFGRRKSSDQTSIKNSRKLGNKRGSKTSITSS